MVASRTLSFPSSTCLFSKSWFPYHHSPLGSLGSLKINNAHPPDPNPTTTKSVSLGLKFRNWYGLKAPQIILMNKWYKNKCSLKHWKLCTVNFSIFFFNWHFLRNCPSELHAQCPLGVSPDTAIRVRAAREAVGISESHSP